MFLFVFVDFGRSESISGKKTTWGGPGGYYVYKAGLLASYRPDSCVGTMTPCDGVIRQSLGHLGAFLRTS